MTSATFETRWKLTASRSVMPLTISSDSSMKRMVVLGPLRWTGSFTGWSVVTPSGQAAAICTHPFCTFVAVLSGRLLCCTTFWYPFNGPKSQVSQCKKNHSFTHSLHLWLLLMLVTAFSASTLLVGHQEEHQSCKNWVMRRWSGYLSGARYRLHVVQLIPLPSQNCIISCFI